MIRKHILWFSVAAAAVLSCKDNPVAPPGGATTSAPASASAAASAAPEVHALSAAVREGGALVRSPSGDALYLADEDHHVLRRIPLPLPLALDVVAKDAGAPEAGTASNPVSSGSPVAGLASSGSSVAGPGASGSPAAGPPPGMITISVPGAPAQVLALGDGHVLVTIRDPSMLLIMKPDPSAVLAEAARVALPGDAWGIALSPDEKTALVSSAWTHQVSAVDLVTRTKRWSIDVAREPRGIVIRPDGSSAYVTHLVGSEVTRIDGIAGPPTARAIPLPPAPARAPSGKTLRASLGYAATLSDDGRRLFVARHALGAIGPAAWFGAATVDVLATRNDTPVIPKRTTGLPTVSTELLNHFVARGAAAAITTVPLPMAPFVQPRAMVYRKSTKTLLIAGEGDDQVVEVDALSPSPALQVVRSYSVGDGGHVGYGIATHCGAPTGIALSKDERKLYVFCRATNDLAAIKLDDYYSPSTPVLHIAEDTLGKDAALGRRFFFSGTDSVSSGGMGCAGCHPEGRDDGNVWHEADIDRTSVGENLQHRNFIGEPENAPNAQGNKIGFPRQTPMLAGRVKAAGPYGWHAQNKDLADRVAEGFGLHRWGPAFDYVLKYVNKDALVVRARFLGAFLREGLVPPPLEQRDLTPVEQQGKQVFLSAAVGCAKCHVPESEYTDRTAYPLARLAPPPGFEDEKDLMFKTPSLRFVAGTPPYFHDGHASSLEEVVEKNNDRMGRTNQLSNEDRAALVAFLRTL
jgi:cytochrome c peroxidase